MLVTLKKNQDLDKLLRAPKLVCNSQSIVSNGFEGLQIEECSRQFYKSTLDMLCSIQMPKSLISPLALVWLIFILVIIVYYVHHHFIKHICINETNIGPLIHPTDIYLLSTSYVPRHIFGKQRLCSESSRVVGFCPYGVYIILVEETNYKQVNKSNVISERKSYKEN